MFGAGQKYPKVVLIAPPTTLARLSSTLAPGIIENIQQFPEIDAAKALISSGTQNIVLCHRSKLAKQGSPQNWREIAGSLPLLLLTERLPSGDDLQSIEGHVDEIISIDDVTTALFLQACRFAIRMQRFHAQYIDALESSDNAIVVLDDFNEIIYLNSHAQRLLEGTHESLIGTRFKGEVEVGVVTEVALPDQSTVLVDTQKISWHSRNVRIARLRDVASHANDSGPDSSTIDTLTALSTSSYFQDQLATAIHIARKKKVRLAVMFISFEKINRVKQTLGGPGANQLLRLIADRLRKASRADTIIGRFSDREFCVLTENAAIGGESIQARRLLEILGEPYSLSNQSFTLTSNIGIASYPESGEKPRALIAAAESASQKARSQGANKVVLFSSEAVAAERQRQKIEATLGQAIRRNEFTLAYQPLFDARGNQQPIVEVLLRWLSRDLGVIRPDDFIPIAESGGWIEPIGSWVIVEACRELAQWSRDPIIAAAGTQSLAINISHLQLMEARFPQFVARVLAETGIAPQQLWLEISEGPLITHLIDCRKPLRELRELGVSIAVDDFGTSNNSLEYLADLPVDAIKIDRKVTHEIASSSASVIHPIVKLAKNLGLRIIGEGVETKRELSDYASLNVDYVQGYLLAKPMSKKDFLKTYGS